ncbi:MAG: 4-diphosphocytidyl-2C-methyl-D-erythritol synthase [Rhodobacteraceae bacterium]|jgi:CTP:molybdopterin cytidylyltransferase MocA|nr:4-diphosphocytidyl-2C-methyl-D-erythritol synthase [Paracoccaceae bacterium]|tara:strand:+ start:748 stop:1317 length:570 start_codon:yes stop_codon:yes gene_type:complete
MRGTDKLLKEIDGVSLLRNRALVCLNATNGKVFITIPPNHPERVAQVSDLPVSIVLTEGSKLGLSHSIKRGLLKISNTEVMLILADLIKLSSTDLLNVFKASKTNDSDIIRGINENGVAGHPVLVRNTVFKELKNLSGEQGANSILKEHIENTTYVKLPNNNATFDLDTPEEWDAWQKDNLTQKKFLKN